MTNPSVAIHFWTDIIVHKKLYPYCLELVGSRNGLDRDLTIELNKVRALC